MARTILVVEDDQIQRSRLEQLLGNAGYQVSTANNGTEALATVKREKPDLIVMDATMPAIDGFAAARRWDSDDATKGIPVVFVTGKNQKADLAWGKIPGDKRCVAKRYSEQQIFEPLKA